MLEVCFRMLKYMEKYERMFLRYWLVNIFMYDVYDLCKLFIWMNIMWRILHYLCNDILIYSDEWKIVWEGLFLRILWKKGEFLKCFCMLLGVSNYSCCLFFDNWKCVINFTICWKYCVCFNLNRLLPMGNVTGQSDIYRYFSTVVHKLGLQETQLRTQ